jgi:hypothetical protein
VRFPYHGGLTRAALGNVRLCTAQIAISPAGIRTPTQEQGRKPHVACEHPRSATNARCLPARFPNHRGLTPAALVGRAFVHCECRYFSGDRRRAPGAADVSQPWGAIRSRVVNVITPRKPIAVAGAVSVPRRADARRSCKRAFEYCTGCSFASKYPRRRTTKSGGPSAPPWHASILVRQQTLGVCRCDFRSTAG